MKDSPTVVFVKKVIHTLLTQLAALSLCFTLYILFYDFIFAFYEKLASIFPDSIPIYNVMLDKKKYEATVILISGIGSIFALAAASFFAVVLNGRKKHYFFNKTHGFYKFREGVDFYLRNYLIPDIISVLSLPILASLIVHAFPALYKGASVSGYLPELLYSLAVMATTPFSAIYCNFGLLGCIGISVSAVALGCALAIPCAVIRYRGDALAHSLE